MSIPKIIGIEQEYAVALVGRGEFDPVELSFLVVNSFEKATEAIWDYDTESPLLDARGFRREGEDTIISNRANYRINNLLMNGARFYVDHAHPEFSTAECLTARDAVAFDKAGEKVLLAATRSASERTAGEVRIYKNNTDHKGNSYGTHENYLMDSKAYAHLFPKYPTYPEYTMRVLVPYLVTRQIFCGAGKVGNENGTEACDYQISQRADFFEAIIGGQTTHTRPIVNTRDEPHADKSRFSRLHVIIGDANMSEVSAFLKVGITQLILEMIEDDLLDLDLALDDPVRTLVGISHDVKLERRFPLKRGIEMTAVEIQRCYLDAAMAHFGSRPDLSEERRLLLAKWAKVLDALEREPRSLNREIDWVIKLHLMERARERKQLTWRDPRIRRMDIQYHDIRPSKGLMYALEAQGRVERLLSDEEILRFVEHPPEDTRAYFRAECLRRYRESISHANWDILTFELGDSREKKVPLADPTKGTRPMVQDLLDGSPDVKTLLDKLATA